MARLLRSAWNCLPGKLLQRPHEVFDFDSKAVEFFFQGIETALAAEFLQLLGDSARFPCGEAPKRLLEVVGRHFHHSAVAALRRPGNFGQSLAPPLGEYANHVPQE